MKVLAKTLGPLLRRIDAHQVLSAYLTVLVCAIGAALTAFINVMHLTDGWTKVTGMVTRAGVTAASDNPANTNSVVAFAWHGHIVHVIGELSWTVRTGARIPAWVRGSQVLFHFPPNFGSPVFWPIFFAVITAIVLLFGGGILVSLIREFDAEAEYDKNYKEMAADQKLPAPKTIDKLVNFMISSGDAVVTRDDANAPANSGTILFCSEGVDEFANRHFPGRDVITLGELIPHVRDYSSADWAGVIKVVLTKLGDLGIIQKFAFYHLETPSGAYMTFQRAQTLPIIR